MLPTTGFFKNIDCPFYEDSCDRPYCHFKHRKKGQESVKVSAASAPPEIPTYNPTPKSQLANARSHIPISYVPDLAVRTERNNFRSLASYRYGDKQPTYKPTPLSILSTSKGNSSKSNESKQWDGVYDDSGTSALNTETAKYNPTFVHENHEDSSDINFEGLEKEFDMIDEIISDSGAGDMINGDSESTEDEKCLVKVKSNSSESSKSKHLSHLKSSTKSKSDSSKKHNGKVSETSNKTKSESRSKSGSHSNRKESSKSESRNKKDSKSSKSNRDDKGNSSKNDEKRKSSKSESKEKKNDTKEKSEKHKHKENSSDKYKHKYKSKSRERDKEKKASNEKKYKEKETSNKRDSKTKASEKLIKESSEVKVKVHTDTDQLMEDCDMSNEYDNDDYMDDLDSDLEGDPLEECYKIFTEYKPTEPEIFPISDITKQDRQVHEPYTVDDVVSINRKRVAHENASRTTAKIMFNKPKAVASAAQTMVNRLKAARLAQTNNEQIDIISEINRQILLKRPAETPLKDFKKLAKISTSNVTQAKSENRISKPSTSTTLIDDIISGKSTNTKPRRIAPVQNVNSIQRAKAKIEEMAKMRAVNAITKTSTQSLTKGAKRVAHVPEYSVADIPEVLEAEHSKLPVNVRSRYLIMILDECVKLYLDKEEAQQRALNEEYKCYCKCKALVTYRNSAMLAINRLRKELQEREMSGLGPIFPGEASNTSKDNTCDLRGQKFYENIKRYILSDEELILHGFPREGKTPGRACIKNQKQTAKGYLSENDRICCRCSKHYKVDDEGFPLYAEECLYHPLKKRTFRGESIYLCCRSSEDTGCVTATNHVCETQNTNDGEVEGYQTTMPPEYEDDPRSYEVFALDCEMCYTTKGLELTRVTIVNAECKTVYESLVKPLNSIIDYNTRFSGITEEQMNRTATSILQVQANILHLCNSNTILIGHSLESDMKALKIIHSTIIDTSVLFPHKFGLPHKRALRDLAREYLKKIIQNDISGHDSAEDALTCMELVQWKVKEEFKTRGVKV